MKKVREIFRDEQEYYQELLDCIRRMLADYVERYVEASDSGLMPNGGGVVVVGSETSGGIQNVCFRNITGVDCIRGIDVKGAIGRGNVIEDIDFENITIGRCRAGILVGFTRSSVNGATDDIPIIRNISLENVSVEQSNVGAKFVGLPDFPVRNLHIKNVRVAGEDVGKIEYVEGLTIDKYHLETSEPVDVTLLGGHVIE